MLAKRHRSALLLSVALAGAFLLWLVAPALSTRAYVPKAVDFTQAVPKVEQLVAGERAARVKRDQAELLRGGTRGDTHFDERPVTLRTPPIEAPRHFDAVGVAGEMRPLEFRARADGGEWSGWVETANGDPVFTGGTDWVQVRSRGIPIEGELHYVNVSGDTTELGGLVTELRSSVNSAVISLAGTPIASADSPKPQMISRRDWGANSKGGGCKPRQRPELGKVKAGVIHHTVSTNNYTEAEAPGMVLAICRYHRNGNGWNDIGYNALADKYGNLYVGRAGGAGRPVIGAHAEGHNSQTTGIASLGEHGSAKAPATERRAIARFLAWKLDKAGRQATGHVFLRSAGGATTRAPRGKRVKVKPVLSHSDLNFTECSGSRLRRQIPKIRRKVQARMDSFDGGGRKKKKSGGGKHEGGAGGTSPS